LFCEVKLDVVKLWGLGKKEEAGVDAALIFLVYTTLYFEVRRPMSIDSDRQIDRTLKRLS
jgi:hypothetical protein